MASVIEFQLRNREPRRTGASQAMAEIIILPTVRVERLPGETDSPVPDSPDSPMQARAGKR